MEVYFVRHGQTDGNVAKRHQHSETSLNEVGIEQAKAAAAEVVLLNPTHIISSINLRAVETTRIIAASCVGIIPDTNQIFEELRRPDNMVGGRFVSLNTVWYVWRWFYGFLKEEEKGETYPEFVSRVKEARLHLESLPSDAIVVVVSHAIFINFFLECMCEKGPMNFWRAAKLFWQILTIRNATIVHVRFAKSEEGDCGWEFVSAESVHP